MFGNLSESINMNNKDMLKNNTEIIKNDNHNKFAGGFKQASILKNKSLRTIH